MIDHLADLRSDLSRFHRVDDIERLDGPRFMELAWRVSAYEGVIAMRLQEQQQAGRGSASAAPSRGRGTSQGGARVLPLAGFAATHGDLIEKRRVPR